MMSLPAPVGRFMDMADAEGPANLETVVIEASARMRRPRLPPISLRVTLSHHLGYEFVHDIRIGLGRLTLRFGLDAYVDGRGLMKVGPAVQSGPEFDQGALIAMWGEALAFPSAWRNHRRVRWHALDDDTAMLTVAGGPDGDIPITVAFDPASGCPAWVKADRHKSRGAKIGWRGVFADWRRFAPGVLAPGRFLAAWADEPRPWIDIRTRSVRLDVPIDDALALARRALAAAG